MGLLDDAIREHLELKRRHGADPDEVARQENEALGATRRAEFARPEGDEPAAAAAPEPPAPEPSPEATTPEPPADAAAPAPSAPEDLAPAEPEAPVAEAEEPVEAGDEREPFDIEADQAPPSSGAWLEDEPDEVPADETLDRPRGDQEDDVLEETPDFLQETPEHDRLWFEQRPPRDFDWDK
jgi:hypothetical protein